MKRKDVISFLGMICYIIFVFGSLRMYFTTDECYDENRLSCIHQNSIFDINEYDDYLAECFISKIQYEVNNQ